MLTVTTLDAGYAGGSVLHDVNLHVPSGSVLGLVGHNGAGKTTLIHAIAGLLRPYHGRIQLDDMDITHRPAHRIARAGILLVPQGRRVFASLTVEEHLSVGNWKRNTRAINWTPQRVLELFPSLAARLSHRGSQLSGGEQQMLAIARALLGQPKLLLLDEPTEGLAPAIAERIGALIKTLSGQGLAILLASPQAQLATAAAAEVLVLSSGRVVASLGGNEIRADPARLHALLAPVSKPGGVRDPIQETGPEVAQPKGSSTWADIVTKVPPAAAKPIRTQRGEHRQ